MCKIHLLFELLQASFSQPFEDTVRERQEAESRWKNKWVEKSKFVFQVYRKTAWGRLGGNGHCCFLGVFGSPVSKLVVHYVFQFLTWACWRLKTFLSPWEISIRIAWAVHTTCLLYWNKGPEKYASESICITRMLSEWILYHHIEATDVLCIAPPPPPPLSYFLFSTSES